MCLKSVLSLRKYRFSDSIGFELKENVPFGAELPRFNRAMVLALHDLIFKRLLNNET